MRTSTSSAAPEARHLDERYARLRGSRTLGGEALERWCEARIGVAGAGVLGPFLAVEAVRSGAQVWICDPDDVEEANLGTQDLTGAGRPKVEAVLERAEGIAPGRMRGEKIDVRRASVDLLRGLDLLVDATDDPSLTFPLVLLSNGLGVPLLRVAVDGSGERELGRVSVSHGSGHACAACTWRRDDVHRATARAFCPGRAAPDRPPTHAGSALAMTVAGTALSVAQRLLGGRGLETIQGRELWIDLDAFGLHALELSRADSCVSGHERWRLHELGLDAAETTVGELLERAAEELGVGLDDVALEPWLHPLALEAWCACGARRRAVGARGASPPVCRACGAATTWRATPSWARFNAAQARLLGITGRILDDLGLPARGAMVTAHAAGAPPLRCLFS